MLRSFSHKPSGQASARMKRVALTASAWWLLVLTGGAAARAEQPSRGSLLIVTPPGFAEATQDLARYRQRCGYEVITHVLASNGPDEAITPEAIRGWIRTRAQPSHPRPAGILLIGDDVEDDASRAAWRLPSLRKPLYRWRKNQRNTFTCDAAYGDLDDDGLADVPVGRLPVRKPEQVRGYVKRLTEYETRTQTADELRALLWIGIPGYNPHTDAFMTPVARSTVKRFLPPTLDPWWLSGDPRWPCWLPPNEQPKRFLVEMARGSAVTLFGGHGSAHRALANISKRHRTTMTVDDLKLLPDTRPSAPAIFLACTIGRFEWAKGPCLAEALLHHPGGPVAVIAATTQSHPLTNYYSAAALAQTMTDGHRTVGAWWNACQRLGFAMKEPVFDALLQNAEGKLEPRINLAKIRRDQPLMYVILGDPLCRLRLPEPLKVGAVRSGSDLVVKADLPASVERVRIDLIRNTPAVPSPELRAPASETKIEPNGNRLAVFEAFNATATRLGTVERPAAGAFRWSGRVPNETQPLLIARETASVATRREASPAPTYRLRVAAFAEGRTWAGVADLPVHEGGAMR